MLNQFMPKALNDDLSSNFDDMINGRDKQLTDCPNKNPDATLQIMFSGPRDAILASTGRSSLCYLMNG